MVGFAPLMPGFIAAVNTSATVSSGATELYYLSYLYGFCASGLVFILLHRLLPAPNFDAFVRNSMSAEGAQMYYKEKWDDIQYEDGGVITGEDKQEDIVMTGKA